MNPVLLTLVVVFFGTTPSEPEIRQRVGIPPESPSELLQWRLVLARDAQTGEPAGYELSCAFGTTAPNVPGIAHREGILHKKGVWTTRAGPSGPASVVYDLDAGLSLAQIGPGVLHLLDSRGHLLPGNGGWSYTFNRADSAEPLVDPALARNQPDLSYRISPRASGPGVLGIFEGRTPAQRIARQLGKGIAKATSKVKWRLTLWADPATGEPVSYKLEGSLYREGAREGTWSREKAEEGPGSVLRLDAAGEGAPLLLLQSENSLFFLDARLTPLVGNEDYSYTLDKWKPRGEAAR